MSRAVKFVSGFITVALIDTLMLLLSGNWAFYSGFIAGFVLSNLGFLLIGMVREERGWPVIMMTISGVLTMVVMGVFIATSPFGIVGIALSFSWLYLGSKILMGP